MAELGFFGILIPEEHGGLGLGIFEYALIVEELARAWMSVASLIARASVHCRILGGAAPKVSAAHGTGEYLGAFALSEAEAGSDVAALTTRAQRTSSGWSITGQKMWCTFADRADYLQSCRPHVTAGPRAPRTLASAAS